MEQGILITAISTGALAFFAACFCIYKQRKNRELLEFAYRQLETLEDLSAANRESIEIAAQRVTDQARRIAWLESRLRQTKPAKMEIVRETNSVEPAAAPKRLSITERRHRILSLARKGQNAETIAETLGMLPGEVELIINLNRASFARAA